MFRKSKEPIHFIGIGGIGMSGIAEILYSMGFPVSGSDLNENDTVKRLRDLGIRIHIGHRPDHLAGAKVVVYSSAVKKDNPELLEARRLKLPVVPRAEMLAELMRLKYGLAVAGSHGKTTTTSMLGAILSHANLDPTIVVGGKVDALGGNNAKSGKGEFIVAEADESDGSFLKLSPTIEIITNIDNDHLDHHGSIGNLRKSFVEFADKVPYYGCVIACIDDEGVAAILPDINKPLRTYGFSEKADFRIENYVTAGKVSHFHLTRDGIPLCEVELSIPGRHNALNATATIIAALEIDIELKKIIEALKLFTGVRRRFERRGEFNGVSVFDDYGHHPTEIKATLQAAREYWDGRVVVAFQPHRFTRTQICWDDFGPALKGADHVFLMDVYPAGENAIPGIDSKTLATAIGVEHTGGLEATAKRIREASKYGDLVITMGAGSVTQLGTMLVQPKK